MILESALFRNDMPIAARPDHIALMVKRLADSAPYYEALPPLLGFSRLQAIHWKSPNGFNIQLHEAKPGTSAYERYGAGMNHFGFSVPDPADVVAVRDAMARAGFDVPAIQNLDGVTALFMKDPDGIRFEVSYFPPEIDLSA
jgi:catechol 2,3-dioxygenase-like lactoylglutathione lyase family enzyme